MKLSQRQIDFARHYAVSGCAAKAARAAGYSARTAKSQGSRLLTNADLLDVVRSERNLIESRHKISKERALQELLEAIDISRTKSDPAGMIAGWREIGRICGYYDKEKEAKVSINITSKRMIDRLEALSDSELMSIVNSHPDS